MACVIRSAYDRLPHALRREEFFLAAAAAAAEAPGPGIGNSMSVPGGPRQDAGAGFGAAPGPFDVDGSSFPSAKLSGLGKGHVLLRARCWGSNCPSRSDTGGSIFVAVAVVTTQVRYHTLTLVVCLKHKLNEYCLSLREAHATVQCPCP